MSEKEWFLRSEEGICPDILLSVGEMIVLGRGPLTCIKDRRLGRQQVQVLYSGGDQAEVTQLGLNKSVVSGKALRRGNTKVLKLGEGLCLLENKYKFSLRKELLGKVKGENLCTSPNKKIEIDRNSEKPIAKAKPSWWAAGLRESLQKPELFVHKTEKLVVIKDKYPKAKYHYLVIPSQNIDNLQSLRMEHIQLLETMRSLGDEMVQRHFGYEFKIGFHAVPSMVQLHLHVISQDFCSDSLKTSKHWNSFTSGFFLSFDEVFNELKEKGFVGDKSDKKLLLGQKLKCHRCEYQPRNMPDLKKHILNHL